MKHWHRNQFSLLALAREFRAEGPRAIATIAIAEAILDPKKVSR